MTMWKLVVIVLGTTPVETGLHFDHIEHCYQAEERMRAEIIQSYNTWLEFAKANPKVTGYPGSQKDMMLRLAFGVCVPTA
jgi:hypothetical protein